MFVQCIVYCVRCTPSPQWLKSVPGWPAISVSTWQESRVGQIVWFGCLSAISQLASREGEGGGVRQLCLHSVTQPFTTWPRWREQGGGLCSLPLGLHHTRIYKCTMKKFGFKGQMRNEPLFIVIYHSSLVKGAMNAARVCKLRNGVKRTPQFFFYSMAKGGPSSQ
jgi:hypothetical protein